MNNELNALSIEELHNAIESTDGLILDVKKRARELEKKKARLQRNLKSRLKAKYGWHIIED